MSPPEPSTPHRPAVFVTTRWTRVIEAQGPSPEAQTALSELCEAYYEAVHAFIRRSVPENDARDLTQEFFRRVLAGSGFAHADQ